MLFTALATVLTFTATTASAAACAAGKMKFRIHSFEYPDQCVGVRPDVYTTEAWSYKHTEDGVFMGPALELQPCNSSNSQIWEWFVDGNYKMIRNPNQVWPPAAEAPKEGRLLNLYNYRVSSPEGLGLQLSFKSKRPEVTNYDSMQWSYTTDRQFINGRKWDGSDICMHLQTWNTDKLYFVMGLRKCDTNSPSQRWNLEYFN